MPFSHCRLIIILLSYFCPNPNLTWSLSILLFYNISLVFFFNNNEVFFFINIYLDSLQLALKYLKDTEVDIHNVLVITGDFNIRDS